MNITEQIFNRYNPNINKLLDDGIPLFNNTYTIEKYFNNKNFKAVIKISETGEVFSCVYDEENNDEFLPLRIDNNQGSFIGEIREEYKNILLNIRNEYFFKTYFSYPQSNRITALIIEKYKNEPEFLWDKFSGCGVFRHSITNKWYGIIMDVDNSKLQSNKSGLVEVLNIKLPPPKIQELLKKDNFYSAYHMNKKYWLSIILNDTLKDDIIFKLLEQSYNLTK